MSIALALSLVVVAYNNVVNRWPPFHGAAYVPMNLAFAVTATTICALASDLSAAELGLDGDLADLTLPAAVVALVALGGLGLASSRHARHIADERVAGLRGGALAWYVLARIPFGTAVAEELLFRGVLFAVWRAAETSVLVAALSSSAAFGLWHVAPTVIALDVNDPDASRRKVGAAVVCAVLFTTVAGLGLTWLRLESGGLLAPTVLHAGVNSAGAMAAVAARRRKCPGT